MKQFTDTTGRTWDINMSVGAIERVKDLLKINLLDPLSMRSKKRGGRALLTRIQFDPALLVDIVFVIVKPQADKQGVTDLDFAEGLGGQAAYDAYEAFMHEWRDFFRALRRETEARAIETNVEVIQAEDRKSAELIKVARKSAEEAAAKAREKAVAKMVARGPSETSTASPESSASTPPP